MAGACEGLAVVELGAGSIASSVAGMMFADNGARVIKVEPPEGDRLREGWPSGFLVWNRGKESVVADLRTPAGQAAARELIANADVVIEAFGVGVAESWGLGYDDLKSLNPVLVYCSIKGFGSTGAYAHIPAYDGAVSAKVGFWTMGAFGIREGPTYNGAFMASKGAAHQAAGSIMGALIARNRTGRGQRLEATLVQGLNPYDYFGTMIWQDTQRKMGNASGTSAMASMMAGATRTAFPAVATADGRWLNFTHMMPHQAQALSRAVGCGDSIDDPRFARQPVFASAEDAQEWEDMIWRALRTKTYAEWEPILLADPNIAFEMARTSEEALDHAQIRHNGERIVVDDPDHGPVEQVGPVAIFSRTPAAIERSAPRLGQNAGPFAPRPSRPQGPAPAHPLSGITIVDFGYFYAMPYGLTMAAALGARVIKLEPEVGDPMRTGFAMPEVTSAKTMEGKESLALDLSRPEARDAVHKLLASADAFVDGFRPGVADRLGLDEATVRSVNPEIFYLKARGYGDSGTYAPRPIYAGVASALAGQVTRHAGYWLDPELAKSLDVPEAQAVVLPRLRGPVDGDANAAVAVFTALLIGLYERTQSAKGQSAVTTMIGGNTLAYADDAVRYRDKKPIPLPDPENYGLHALERVYPAAQGWVYLAAPRQKEWEALVQALGRPELADDRRFATPVDRRANDDALAGELGALLATRSADDWERELVPKHVACVAAFHASQSEFTCTDPVLRETELVVEVESPIFGKILRYGLPAKFSETPGRIAAGVKVGQQTKAILRELGYSDAAIDKLHADRVAFSPTD